MATLHDTLWNLTVDDLRYRLKFLDPGSKATRKSDFIDGIKTELTGPGLVATWNDLDETGRLAVIEAVHDADHRHHPVRFRSIPFDSVLNTAATPSSTSCRRMREATIHGRRQRTRRG
jgi:hypothetical protein